MARGTSCGRRVTLTNTGKRPALETVQAYIADIVTSVTWAEPRTKVFTQATIQPGEHVKAHIEIPVAACSIVDVRGVRVVEPGTFELLVGRSSRDADLLRTTFDVRA